MCRNTVLTGLRAGYVPLPMFVQQSEASGRKGRFKAAVLCSELTVLSLELHYPWHSEI